MGRHIVKIAFLGILVAGLFAAIGAYKVISSQDLQYVWYLAVGIAILIADTIWVSIMTKKYPPSSTQKPVTF